MPGYTYKVIPFIGKLKSGQSPEEVSKQLGSLINENTSDGWEFMQLGGVNIEVEPGCLGALTGAKSAYIRYDQLIFRKPI